MADNSITYKIFVDADSGTATIRNLKGELVAGAVPLENLRREFGNFAKTVNSADFNKFKSGLDSATNAQKNLRTASGGATSAVLELGRVVQDAPYGIRGMANNITQLASQMAFATKDAGSFGGALKDMGKSMMGPLGIVFAISIVVSLLDGLYGANKKAEESSKDLTNVFGEETTKLMVLKSALDDTNVSLESKTELVNNANKEFKDLNVSLDENGKITEESAKRLDQLSLSFIKNAKARAIAKLIQDEMAKQAEVEARKTGESLAWYETTYYAFKAKIFGFQQVVNQAISKDTENQKEEIKDSADLVKRYTDMLTENDAELAKLFINGGSDKKTKTNKLIDAKDFEGEIFSIEKILRQYREKDLLDSAKTELEKVKAKQKIAEDSLRDSFKTSRKKNEDEYLDYLVYIDKQLADKKIKEEYAESLRDAAVKSKEAADKISYENYLKALKVIADKYKKDIGILQGVEVDEALIKRVKKYQEYARLAKEVLSSIADFIDSEFKRELTLEQNKTNALNNELNQRLLNENLSKSERAKIQNEIAKNDEALRKKQEIIEKKRFNTNKAFAVASALVDTASSAVKAYGSQLVVGDPSSLFRAQIAAGVATALGLAQVAMIARQQFQSSAGSATPIRGLDSSGGGEGDRSFNYNLVGNNQANQIAEALQGQFSNPLKAYVVSREVTTQQELDMNIKSGASF